MFIWLLCIVCLIGSWPEQKMTQHCVSLQFLYFHLIVYERIGAIKENKR